MKSQEFWPVALPPRAAFCALLLLLILFGHTTAAPDQQSPVLPSAAPLQSGSTRFETLSIENGLSQSTVRAILQDSKGFMWFGTEDGLNKYDGYSFTLYKHDPNNLNSIADNKINTIFLDSHGELWIGTANGLDHFIHDKETFVHLLPGVTVNAVAQDSQGQLWIASAGKGLLRITTSGQTIAQYRHSGVNIQTLISDHITALIVDPSDGLWVGTENGLDYLNPKTGKISHFQNDPRNPNSLSNNHILALCRDRLGTLWIGTEEGGLNHLDPTTNAITHYVSNPNNPYSLAGNFVRSIYEDHNGRLWVGGRNGLHLLNRVDEYFTRYQHDPYDRRSLSNDYILSIYEDRSGVLWIGTYGGGISKYAQASDRFTLYQHRPSVPNSLSNDIVYAVYEDSNETVWVGTMDGGLNRLNTEANTFTFYQNVPYDLNSLSSNDVRAIFEDRDGYLWIGTNGGGLNRFNPDTNQFDRYQHSDINPYSISDNRITAIYGDRVGNLWIGTQEGGLELMDRANDRFIHLRNNPVDPSTLSSNTVQAIYEDHAGNLWVGTDSGLCEMNPKTLSFKCYKSDPSNPSSLSNNHVLSILEMADNSLWVGTMLGGLNRFDPKDEVFQSFSIKQGLPGDSVYGILADRSGYLWLSTNKGLSRFDPRTETFRNYDRQDGLQSYEFNPGAYAQGPRGRMYFGGVQGFNAFDPDQVEDNEVAPPIVITAFKKFNQTERKDLFGGEKIELSYQDNFVSFEFSALDYTAPDKNQYAYMLEGFDKDWVYTGNRRTATYTNLRGGHYVFKVIGSNPDGVWNDTGTTVQIDVIPPIWEQWWFMGTLAAMMVGGAMGVYRLRVMGMQAQTRRLEEQVRDRTQEIERRRQVAEGLREMLAILNSNKSLTECLASIIRQIVRLMDAQAVLIFRCGEEGYPLIVASNLPENEGPRGIVLPSLPAWMTQPLLQNQILTMDSLDRARTTYPDLKDSAFGQYNAILAVPLAVNDRVDGGLVLFYNHAREFSEEDYQMAVSFSDHAALAIANAQLRSQAEEIAVSAERSRLARDLHDAVTQTLFATSLIAEVLPRLWERNPEAGKQKITEIRELTRGALAEMRTLLMELRPTALEDVPLPDLLQQLSEAFTGRARVPVTLDTSRPLEMPSNVKIAFYRIAQEALNNIQKHSHAESVEIWLREDEEAFRMRIRDDGIGFNPDKKLPDHFGLGIMEERAQSVGAQYQVESQLNEGTQITVTWLK